MPSKTITLKFMSKYKITAISIITLLFGFSLQAQDTDTLIIDEKSDIGTEIQSQTKKDTLVPNRRFKIDGVIGVVGNYIVLESDIDKTYLELQQQGIAVSNISRCELFGKLLEDKLYAHHAIQDSIVVSDAEINARLDQQIEYMVSQLGSEERVYQYYRRNSMAELRRELFEINKSQQLAALMQERVFQDVEVTPEEVRQFFYAIPEDDRPIFGAELEVAQIVIKPEITQEAKQRVIDELNDHRRDVVENGASFTTKVVLYSDEPGAAARGGLITLNRRSPFVKEFKDVVFSLNEGEVSEPFETEFGYHIVFVERVRGQERDVRHVLKIPRVDDATIQKAREKIDNIRGKIVSGEISFADAARSESDEKETRNNGGQLINPLTGDTRFELTKMDPNMSAQVYNLADGEVSPVFVDEDRTGRRSFKILTVTNRIEERVADYSIDYEKIRELALTQKRIKEIEKWQEKKIKETYININAEYTDCEFTNNWTQK
jgi:peptidyl-prolyl cis-trans isomerase SurA